MTVTRVSTFGLQSQTFRNTQRVQAEIAALSNQISSGKKSTTFEELGSQTEFYAGLQAKLARTNDYLEQNAVLENRLGSMESSIEIIIDSARKMKGLIMQRRNGAVGEDVKLAIQGSGLLETVVGQLNTSLEGRYLFSGSKTDTRPVETPLPFGPPGVPDNGYYNGDDVDVSARINDSTEIAYGVRANDPVFEKLISAFSTAIQGDNEADPDFFMTTALDMLDEAMQGLTDVQSEVRSNIVKVTTASDQLDTQRIYWKQFADELVATDIAEATSELALRQLQIQASYQVFSRISNLSLADYLR